MRLAFFCLMSLVIPGAQRRAPLTSELRHAVAKGLAYLGTDQEDLSARIVLDYLQRRFQLRAELAFQPDARAMLSERPLWGRLVGVMPEEPSEALSDVGNNTTDRIVMPALYCDIVPLPGDFVSTLTRLGNSGGYELTHVYLTQRIVEELGCIEVSDPMLRSFSELEGLLLRAIRASQAQSTFENLDLQYEALALRSDRREASRPSGELLWKLIREQRDDGGWPAARDASSSAHPTVMAVWALLCALTEDRQPVGFLPGRQPGTQS